MSRRRLRKTAAHLEITAFINLIVVLVPFLLSTAVFTRLAVMDLQLPAAAPAEVLDALNAETLQLEVVMRSDALEVGDRAVGLIQRLPRTAAGPDYAALAALMRQLKAKFPQARDAALLAEADTPYEQIVQAMDAVRASVTADGPKLVRSELFPRISVGDAPALAQAADGALQAPRVPARSLGGAR